MTILKESEVFWGAVNQGDNETAKNVGNMFLERMNQRGLLPSWWAKYEEFDITMLVHVVGNLPYIW